MYQCEKNDPTAPLFIGTNSQFSGVEFVHDWEQKGSTLLFSSLSFSMEKLKPLMQFTSDELAVQFAPLVNEHRVDHISEDGRSDDGHEYESHEPSHVDPPQGA